MDGIKEGSVNNCIYFLSKLAQLNYMNLQQSTLTSKRVQKKPPKNYQCRRES